MAETRRLTALIPGRGLRRLGSFQYQGAHARHIGAFRQAHPGGWAVVGVVDGKHQRHRVIPEPLGVGVMWNKAHQEYGFRMAANLGGKDTSGPAIRQLAVGETLVTQT